MTGYSTRNAAALASARVLSFRKRTEKKTSDAVYCKPKKRKESCSIKKEGSYYVEKTNEKLVSLFLFCVLFTGLLTAEALAALGIKRITVTENDTRTLYAAEAEKSLGWISTNPAVVEVLTQGGNRCEVRAKSEGTAIVYCRYDKTKYVGNYRRFVQHVIDYEITVNPGRKTIVTFEPTDGYIRRGECPLFCVNLSDFDTCERVYTKF